MARTPRTPKNARAEALAKRRAAAVVKKQKAAFLAAFESTHLVSEAAKVAGIHRQRAYEWRKLDADFATAWSDAEERSTELLEREAFRRAAVGTLKPVFQGGERVGEIREYSDTLLIFLLKARRPDTYRENQRIEHTGPEGGPIAAEVTHVDAKERSDAAREYLARIAGE